MDIIDWGLIGIIAGILITWILLVCIMIINLV